MGGWTREPAAHTCIILTGTIVYKGLATSRRFTLRAKVVLISSSQAPLTNVIIDGTIKSGTLGFVKVHPPVGLIPWPPMSSLAHPFQAEALADSSVRANIMRQASTLPWSVVNGFAPTEGRPPPAANSS